MKVGIIGTGKIGQAIGKLCAAFDTQLIAYDLYPNQPWADQYHCNYVSFDQLIAESDIIILSCNASEENRHLINESVITQMKQWVYLINIAR
jgi:D-lactate dehydrogenase